LGSDEACNRIVGRIKLGSETLATLEGHWDQDVYIHDKRSEVFPLESVYFSDVYTCVVLYSFHSTLLFFDIVIISCLLLPYISLQFQPNY